MRLFYSRRTLEGLAHKVNHGISPKFVPEPSIDAIRKDVLIALKRFNYTVRLASNERDRDKEREEESGSKPCNNTNKTNKSANDGLGTGLRPTSGRHTNKVQVGNSDCEGFLASVRAELLDHLDKCESRDPRIKNKTMKQVVEFTELLTKAEDLVSVQTDSTMSRTFESIDDYERKVIAHLAADAKVVSTEILTNEKDVALLELEKYTELLSYQEMGYISNKINSAGVPSPRLLVKDHKKKKH